jgi:two-component system, chemotaxis family, sensor kinase CheA
MFLEESVDNLQTLNESLLQLEQKPDDIDKLNEIFRVAHTIKGMAATMGFAQMAELTHKMEDVLSKFRDGEIKVSKDVVTVLFKCLDTLEQMVNNITEGKLDQLSIEKLLLELDNAVHEEQTPKAVDADIAFQCVKETNPEESKLAIELNEYDINVVKQANSKGYNTFAIKIFLSPSTLLKSARAYLIFKNLEETGEIIKAIPGVDDLETENFDFEIELVLVTHREKSEIYNILINISEVESVLLDNLDIKAESIAKIKSKEISQETIKNEINAKAIDSAPTLNKTTNGDGEPHKKNHKSIRVDLDRLDHFMNMVSELVIHRTRLEQISANYKLIELNETLEQVARTTSDLQDLVMKIRMLPLDIVFSRFPRMVRDLAIELGKEMELNIKGAATELDRTVIDEIGEPLIHLIRNAADHGIESAEERIKQGKSSVGNISLIAYQEGTKAVIKVEDDGAGIIVDKIKEKALDMGINIEGMDDKDIVNLIFMQGFTTNDEVTDISGRGVGMDVVQTKIAALGGTLEVETKRGVGSSFIIRLPLTLQIIQTLLVKVSNETMAISLGYIDRVIDFKEELIKTTNKREVIIFNEKVISFVRLNKRLGLEETQDSKKYIVIVNIGDKTVGLLVDGLLGQREIVIKPLGKTLHAQKEYIGATILGDGLVTLILDVAALV